MSVCDKIYILDIFIDRRSDILMFTVCRIFKTHRNIKFKSKPSQLEKAATVKNKPLFHHRVSVFVYTCDRDPELCER